MRTGLALSLAIVALAACQQKPEPDVERIVEYRCGELEVTAVFNEQDRVNLMLVDRQLSLALTPAASGARFANDRGDVFWTKGSDDAMLTLAGDPTRSCSRIEGS